MIALIAIPHQSPARIHWYEDEDTLVAAAEEYAGQAGHEPPEAHGFGSAIWNAAQELAEDWHGYLLVRSAADLDDVRAYIAPNSQPGGRQHKAHQVAALIEALKRVLSNRLTPPSEP